jgi:ribose transport system substrate-binding protein
MTVSEVAAEWAMEDGGDGVGAIIFTDSTYQIAIDKADRIKETIEAAGGTVLEYVDTPIADTSARMGPLTTSLLQKYGDQWTHALAINDLYFDFMGPALAAAGISSDDGPQAGSAGDGSEAAFQRIRSGNYQTITVAEPLNLQGWQLVDELNRAIQGEACSGYITSPALVTEDGLAKLGDSNQFDPDSPYRDAYAKIWGK